MRHGFSDEADIDVSADEYNRFAAQKVAYLAKMLQTEWLAQEKARSPKWAINAPFYLRQAIEDAQFALRPVAVSDDQRRIGSAVIKQAKEMLETLT